MTAWDMDTSAKFTPSAFPFLQIHGSSYMLARYAENRLCVKVCEPCEFGMASDMAAALDRALTTDSTCSSASMFFTLSLTKSQSVLLISLSKIII